MSNIFNQDARVLPQKRKDWSFRDETVLALRRDEARMLRAKRTAQLCLGVALFTAITGERPRVSTPRRSARAVDFSEFL